MLDAVARWRGNATAAWRELRAEGHRVPSLPTFHRAEDAPADEHLNWQANREVRHTVIRTIRDRLLPEAPPETSWSGYHLDFTGTVFDGDDFSGAEFSRGEVTAYPTKWNLSRPPGLFCAMHDLPVSPSSTRTAPVKDTV
jgi:hypothetical protein